MKLLLTLIIVAIFGLATSGQITYPQLNRTVVAQDGDTIESLAKRAGADPIAVAKYNGLLPNTKLFKGREVNLPGPDPLCSLQISDLPAIRGMSLGMPKAEMLDLLRPRARELVGMAGEVPSSQLINNAEGIDGIRFNFWDGRLLSFGVSYDRSDLTDDKEFAAMIADRLHLPQAWKDLGGLTGQVMNCGSFAIKVHVHDLSVDDLEAERRKAQAEKMEIERKRKEFKP